MRSSFIISLLAVLVPVLGAPTLVPITKRAGPSKENSYILTFKEGVPKSAAVAALKQKFAEPDSHSSMTYEYGDFFHGVAVLISSPDMLNFVQSMNDIASIEPDAIMSLSYELGLDGLPNTEPENAAVSPLSPRATQGGNGSGVVVYSIDTGIYTGHSCFGGRATWGATFGGYKDADGNGHGTHTAGTAVGEKYGLATGATIKAVKVMSDQGSGSTTDIMAGLEWVANDAGGTGKASVVNMSIGGPANESLDKAVKSVIQKGLHFTIAAGNSMAPAAGFSPARVEEANTIGAVDKDDKRASFSNFGPPVDVWALGVNVLSAWIDGPTSDKVLSGTSMAAPKVAGILAAAISAHGNKTPAELSSDLTKHAREVERAGGVATDLIAEPW